MAIKALEAINDDERPHRGEVMDGPAPANESDDGQAWFPSAAETFAIDDVVSEVVRVPEWVDKQGRVPSYLVYSLDGGQVDKYQNSQLYMDKKGRTQLNLIESNAKLLVLACRNQDGSPLFTRFDIDQLQKKNAAGITRLAKVARRLSGLDNSADEEEERRKEGLD